MIVQVAPFYVARRGARAGGDRSGARHQRPACAARAGRSGGGGIVADPAERSGVLAARDGVVRAGRVLSLRQPALERARIPVRHARACPDDQAGPRLHGSGSRAELHLHRRHRAGDGVHRRHPPRQSRSASDVQSAVRAVGGSRRVRVAAVLEEAAGGADARSRPRAEIFAAFANGRRRSEALYAQNLQAIQSR